MSPRKRNPARKNTRRAGGRWTNRERPTAPYRTGDTASVRVVPPTGEGARTYGYATAREAGYQRRLRFRASTAETPAEPGNGQRRAPGTGPAATGRDAS